MEGVFSTFHYAYELSGCLSSEPFDWSSPPLTPLAVVLKTSTTNCNRKHALLKSRLMVVKIQSLTTEARRSRLSLDKILMLIALSGHDRNRKTYCLRFKTKHSILKHTTNTSKDPYEAKTKTSKIICCCNFRLKSFWRWSSEENRIKASSFDLGLYDYPVYKTESTEEPNLSFKSRIYSAAFLSPSSD